MPDRIDEASNNFTLLRLLLALMVVFGHFKRLDGVLSPAFPFDMADLAVDCFFVVSGFLIAGSFDRSRGVVAFYTRRVFRLLPMYAFVVLAQTAIMLALLPGGPFSEPERTLRYLVVNLSFANFLQYDIGGVLGHLIVPGINPSLWTLKIEMTFYLVVPLIVLAVRRWGWGALAVIYVLSVFYYAEMMDLGAFRYAKQLPGQLQFFVVGMGLFMYGRDLRVGLAGSVAVCGGFLALWGLADPMPAGIYPLLVGAFVFCFALRLPVVRMRSDMSYSVYLLHGPLIQTAILVGLYRDTPLALLIVVSTVLALAFLTERLIERPGTAFGKRLSRYLSRPAALASAPQVALAQR
jgi:peptidoglycan/LPS O-acetylase OafA/YrhL